MLPYTVDGMAYNHTMNYLYGGASLFAPGNHQIVEQPLRRDQPRFVAGSPMYPVELTGHNVYTIID